MKLLHVGRRSSRVNMFLCGVWLQPQICFILTFLFENQDDMLDNTTPDKKKNSFSAEELDDDELNRMEDWKPVCLSGTRIFGALAPLAAGVEMTVLPRKLFSGKVLLNVSL